ncbi:hypothetical protein GG344DRAFT_60267 [Lentinula edodes]|nr:hypothetical protein GG344DRAFT_60267 [Lentinula edodes]
MPFILSLIFLFQTQSSKPPLSKYTTCQQASIFLINLSSSLSNSSPPYIHPTPVSFKNNKTRLAYASLFPSDAGCCVSTFLNTNHHGASTLLAFFVIPLVSPATCGSLTPLGVPEWHSSSWHALAVAVISSITGGKHLLLYDVDTHWRDDVQQTRLKSMVWGPLTTLISHLKKKGTSLTVWCSVNSIHRDKQHCIYWSLTKIQQWAEFGDQKLDEPDDPRLQDFVKMEKM